MRCRFMSIFPARSASGLSGNYTVLKRMVENDEIELEGEGREVIVKLKAPGFREVP